MSNQSKSFEFGPFRLEVRERRLTRDGHTIPLRGRVFDTLYALVRRHGCLMTKDELMTAVWPDSIVEETNLNHNICIIRRALGEKVTGQKYVETVPKQGYRFVAEVRGVEEADGSNFRSEWGLGRRLEKGNESILEASSSEPDARSSRDLFNEARKLPPPVRVGWHQHQRIISLLGVAFLALAGYLGSEKLGIFHSLPNSRILLAVLPFEDLTGDSGRAYVADGLNDEIISQLGRWNTARVGVIARTSSKVYQGKQKSIREIGRELGVHYIVEGSVRRDVEQYRISVMLIRVKDQAQLWAANYNRPVDNVTALQVEIASLVTSEIGRRIEVHADYPQSLGTQSLEMRGLGSLTDPRSATAALVHFLLAS